MMRFGEWLENLKRFFSRKISETGYTCDGCGAEVFDYPQERLCEKCRSEMPKNDGSVCPKCGRKTVAEGVCLECKRLPPKFTRGISPFVYRGSAAVLLNRLKNGERYLSFFFGEQMAGAWLRLQLETGDLLPLVVPVPLTEESRKIRGYNQSETLASVIAEKTGGVLKTDLLVKVKETEPQKKLTREERRKNVAGAYKIADREARSACKDRAILLIDDLMTTGATGDECAEALFSAGAARVYFLTAAATAERKL